ncbi:MAG: histidinol dehydrogenase [Desulfocapsaceae bacterium]|nr:histidinol dehydrogenase [Desulfocapsaceae bacterium]
MEYIKKSKLSFEEASSQKRAVVKEILKNIELNGEDAVRDLAAKFDDWHDDFILSPKRKQELIAQVPQGVKDDIEFAYEQVYGFARAQRDSIVDIEKETLPGVRLGQRVIPMEVAGCYIPGGRFAHACSAIMSVATAKAAGVKTVIACSPPRGQSIAPAVVYAMELSGADVIMQMGGVQAIATMAYGLFTGKPANILVGPGNAYVAEAKAILAGTGRCAIDVFAGPTESSVIADKTADPLTIAIDLVSQAEHGIDSPVWLHTDSREIAEQVAALVPKIIEKMPDPDVPLASWENYGEIILCKDRDELVTVSDQYASEHVQVLAEDLNWWVENLQNYGSLFLGEGSTVAQGDKCSGTNHILPTRRAGYMSGGLNVHKFLKITTYQEISPAANKIISSAASRLSRVEGMEGHARACDWRLRKFFPDEEWDFEVYKQPDLKAID